MPSIPPSSEVLIKIRKQLAQFSRLEAAPVLSAAEKADVRTSVYAFNEASDYQTIGICADTLAQAKAAAEAYVAALSRSIQLELDQRTGPVYLKFNTLNGSWYLDDYSGSSRGVLITFHASDPEAEVVNGTFGPLPFTLFD